MKYIFITIISILFLISCQTTKYIIIPLTDPPTIYIPPKEIRTQKEFLKEYQKTLIKISEWQKWYNTQISSNYFYN